MYIKSQDLCFKNYSTNNGLPSSQVYNIFQDKNGDIWFATDRGITNYNGYKFENYDHQDGITNSTVFKFFPQKNGKIWCSTIDNSWFHFDNGKTNFTKYTYSDSIQKYSKNLLPDDLFIDSNNTIHIAFENSNRILTLSNKGEILQIPESKIDFQDTLRAYHVLYSPNHSFTYFASENNNDLKWPQYNSIKQYITYDKLGYRKGDVINNVALFSTGKNLSIKNNNETKEIEFNHKIIGLGKYDSNHFWLGLYKGGVKIFDMKGEEKHHFLQNKSITFLFKDQNKGTWISTLDEGVYYAQFDDLNNYFREHLNYVFNISPGKNNSITVSSINGEIYYGDTEHIKKLDTILAYSSSKAFYNFQNDSLNLGSLNDPALPSTQWIVDVIESTQKPLLVAFSTGALYWSGNGMKLINSNQRICNAEWAKNGILFGTYTGLFHYDTITNTERKLLAPEFDIRITDIKLVDKIHYIGTSGNGLVHYNEKNQSIFKLTTKNGLASNLINEVFPENDSVVWVATNQGLNKVSFCLNQTIIETLSTKDGLPDNDITDVYVHDNDVWIGTRSGLFHLDKKGWQKTNPNLNLHLFWEKISTNDLTHDLSQKLLLNASVKNLVFEFHSSYFGNQENLKFRYKLEGFDENWNYIKDHRIGFNTLPSGKYKLILQASVENSEWLQNELNLQLIILPPFYKTWWFICLCITISISIIYLFFRFRVLIYNRDLVRELMRILVKKFKPKSNSFLIWMQGKEIRITSNDVLYIHATGNYLEIQTIEKKYVIRCKIGEFIDLVPDKLEYMRVHRSFIVRLDKVTGKSVDELYISEVVIPIGKTYKEDLRKWEI